MCDSLGLRNFMQNGKLVSKQANYAAGSSTRSYGSPGRSAEETADQICSAINLMLPKGREDAVLRILRDRIASRLPIPVQTGHRSRRPSESSSEEIPMPQRMLGEPVDTNSLRVMRPASPSRPLVLSVDSPRPRIRLLNALPEPERWTPSERGSTPESDVWLPPAKRPKRRLPQRAVTMVDSSAFGLKMERGIVGPLVVRNAANRIENYKCPYCPQLKRRKRDMEAHIECHGNIGAHGCAHCDFATNSRQLFFWHGKVHEPSQNIVKLHAQRATTVAEFPCPECADVYAFAKHLQTHRRARHPKGRARATTRVDF